MKQSTATKLFVGSGIDGFNTILEKLSSLKNSNNIVGMARFGIRPKNPYGISVSTLRELAKGIQRNHEIAQKLWETGIHEAKILASIIEEIDKVDEIQAENWVIQFDSWDICDQVCMNLFEKTIFAYQKIFDWTNRDEEFVKRAGFVLIARLAVSDKKAGDKIFIDLFPILEKGALDERNFVKKAVNWALRQIGKRNINLNNLAIELAKKIQSIDNKSAKWIGQDALKELEKPMLQNKLKNRLINKKF